MGHCCEKFKCLSTFFLFLWKLKSLFLVPWDIYTDVRLAVTHLSNGHTGWGAMTITFLLPSLMFPLHYYQILKFTWAKFKILYLSETQSDEERKNVDLMERVVVSYDGLLAYFEDIPQFILQVYILWKTPVECFTWDSDWTEDKVIALQSILTSFLSISATVVPFYKKWTDKKKEKWRLMTVRGFLHSFIPGTFLNVIPKLMLIAWTFSILNWYGWFFVIPLLLISCIFSWTTYHKLYEKIEKSKNRSVKSDRTVYNGSIFVKFLLPIQNMFGYAGRGGTLMSALVLVTFLIPLGIALHAAVHTSEEVDYFGVFPSDPYPSRVICFTNTSMAQQQERWMNKTTHFSGSCNLTFSAVSCGFHQGQRGQRGVIIIQLSLMIALMSIGPLIAVIIGGRAYVPSPSPKSTETEKEGPSQTRTSLL